MLTRFVFTLLSPVRPLGVPAMPRKLRSTPPYFKSGYETSVFVDAERLELL